MGVYFGIRFDSFGLEARDPYKVVERGQLVRDEGPEAVVERGTLFPPQFCGTMENGSEKAQSSEKKSRSLRLFALQCTLH